MNPMQERRKEGKFKGTELPIDYLKMVTETFTSHFDATLKALKKMKNPSRFIASGRIFQDEIVLTISLVQEGQMAATTLHASIDFDPQASAPTVDELLSTCVDATGSLFAQIFDDNSEAKLERVLAQSAASLEDVPFEWASSEINKRAVFMKIDKSNPHLEQMADEWLAKNDPKMAEEEGSLAAEATEFFEERVELKNPGNGIRKRTLH